MTYSTILFYCIIIIVISLRILYVYTPWCIIQYSSHCYIFCIVTMLYCKWWHTVLYYLFYHLCMCIVSLPYVLYIMLCCCLTSVSFSPPHCIITKSTGWCWAPGQCNTGRDTVGTRCLRKIRQLEKNCPGQPIPILHTCWQDCYQTLYTCWQHCYALHKKITKQTNTKQKIKT